ncbi:MAG: undecaprenyl-diphosphatase UppP [Elusimicrobia bacterium RIFCSPLOWO2_01_FULL_59_12]|nr:MAG: undecaprenyl-diphosphatase UppP [Elusimicrobia bacterium RIFCSPLOWO2_01_FULL_59_12]
MTLFQSLFLGIVQGLGEFLPISSSAHLILLPRFMRWPDQGLAFDVALHLGTLAGVIIYFWKDLAVFIRSFLNPSDPGLARERRLAGQILLATLPGALAGLALEQKVESVFRSPHLIGWTLIGLGVLLALADYTNRGTKSLTEITWGAAAALGVAQAFALVPGVSRSGITITAALFLGIGRYSAARFSFLMSIPIIAGAGVLKFKEILGSPDKLALFVGFTGAALSGFLAIWFLLRYVQTRRYTPFVIYRWLLGALVLLNLRHFQ